MVWEESVALEAMPATIRRLREAERVGVDMRRSGRRRGGEGKGKSFEGAWYWRWGRVSEETEASAFIGARAGRLFSFTLALEWRGWINELTII